jgi:hypothetical protein
MGISVNVALNPTRIAQVVAGGAAVVGGYHLASGVIRTAYREDLLGDPTRIVEVDGRTMIYQTRTPQGGSLTNVMLGAGAVSAAVGGILALGSQASATGLKGLARSFGGVGLFALGLGAIAGATSMAAQYNGADFEPVP